MIDQDLIDPKEYDQARAQLGAAFPRILGYFREDGIKSVEQIEAAMRDRNAAAMVRPAHTLKGESRQFGSLALGDMAERIEIAARRCIELRTSPEEIMADVADLRACFTRTLTMLEDQQHGPVLATPGGVFGRKAVPSSLLGLSRD
ncbi:MAG: Hpt domain-containing protein [Sphingobium sp.]